MTLSLNFEYLPGPQYISSLIAEFNNGWLLLNHQLRATVKLTAGTQAH